MVGEMSGEGGVNFWASENWSWRVHFKGHSPKWRVFSELSVQPCCVGSSGPNNQSLSQFP